MGMPTGEIIARPMVKRACGCEEEFQHFAVDKYRAQRLAKFENRLFAKYAATHGLTFVDIAGQLPFDPDLFLDAVHTSYAGTRMRGWITLNALIPLIEKHLADKSWPRPMPNPTPPLPTITPRKMTLACKA